jgi:Tfp pilus assembly protein PilZ
MADKRYTKRYPKKIRLKFGCMPLVENGVTENVSASGLFIKTNKMYTKNTIIRIEFILPNNIIVKVDGMVIWKREFSSKFIRILKKNGLGIKFTKFYSGEQKYKEMIRAMQAGNI